MNNLLEPETDFEKAILEYFQEIAEMVIQKNRFYGDSFRLTRQDMKHNYGSPKIPFDMHMVEKLRRYRNAKPGDSEDPIKDATGYCGLEAVCSKLDD